MPDRAYPSQFYFSWIVLPRRANHDVADMDMRWLRNDEVDGVGHILPVQQRAEFIVEVLHQVIL